MAAADDNDALAAAVIDRLVRVFAGLSFQVILGTRAPPHSSVKRQTPSLTRLKRLKGTAPRRAASGQACTRKEEVRFFPCFLGSGHRARQVRTMGVRR
jgi:hypothetical protein